MGFSTNYQYIKSSFMSNYASTSEKQTAHLSKPEKKVAQIVKDTLKKSEHNHHNFDQTIKDLDEQLLLHLEYTGKSDANMREAVARARNAITQIQSPEQAAKGIEKSFLETFTNKIPEQFRQSFLDRLNGEGESGQSNLDVYIWVKGELMNAVAAGKSLAEAKDYANKALNQYINNPRNAESKPSVECARRALDELIPAHAGKKEKSASKGHGAGLRIIVHKGKGEKQIKEVSEGKIHKGWNPVSHTKKGLGKTNLGAEKPLHAIESEEEETEPLEADLKSPISIATAIELQFSSAFYYAIPKEDQVSYQYINEIKGKSKEKGMEYVAAERAFIDAAALAGSKRLNHTKTIVFIKNALNNNQELSETARNSAIKALDNIVPREQLLADAKTNWDKHTAALKRLADPYIRSQLVRFLPTYIAYHNFRHDTSGHTKEIKELIEKKYELNRAITWGWGDKAENQRQVVEIDEQIKAIEQGIEAQFQREFPDIDKLFSSIRNDVTVAIRVSRDGQLLLGTDLKQFIDPKTQQLVLTPYLKANNDVKLEFKLGDGTGRSVRSPAKTAHNVFWALSAIEEITKFLEGNTDLNLLR